MAMLSPGERWAMDLQQQLLMQAAGLATRQSAASAEPGVQQEWVATVLMMARLRGGVTMERWAHRIESLSHDLNGIFVPVELDIERAVSLTATIAGVLPQAPSHGRDGTTWLLHRELGLNCEFQDSLNGQDWYTVVKGALTPSSPSLVARVTTALGSFVRLALLCYPVVAKVRIDNGLVQSREFASVNVDDLVISDLRIHVAVRTI